MYLTDKIGKQVGLNMVMNLKKATVYFVYFGLQQYYSQEYTLESGKINSYFKLNILGSSKLLSML